MKKIFITGWIEIDNELWCEDDINEFINILKNTNGLGLMDLSGMCDSDDFISLHVTNPKELLNRQLMNDDEEEENQ